MEKNAGLRFLWERLVDWPPKRSRVNNGAQILFDFTIERNGSENGLLSPLYVTNIMFLFHSFKFTKALEGSCTLYLTVCDKH